MPFAAPTTPITLSKLIVISANSTLYTLWIYDGSLDIRDGIPLSIDLSGTSEGLIGYRARKHTDLIDIQNIKYYKKETFLVDAYSKYHFGGSGEKIDFDLASKASGLGKMILAGGLTPENVEEAIEKVKPWAVDVCSGVESHPGIKDMRLVEKFIKKIIK